MATRPDQITGGCLCASIRYTITFPPSTKWPPESSTCQCTMCRKWTSSLLAHFLTIHPTQLTPYPLSSSSSPSPQNTTNTYTEFESSKSRFRGFCSKCGSSLIWRDENSPETLDLFLGTLDEKWLVREKEVGRALAMPNRYQFWCGNEVEGVSDVLGGGKRFVGDGMGERG